MIKTHILICSFREQNCFQKLSLKLLPFNTPSLVPFYSSPTEKAGHSFFRQKRDASSFKLSCSPSFFNDIEKKNPLGIFFF